MCLSEGVLISDSIKKREIDAMIINICQKGNREGKKTRMIALPSIFGLQENSRKREEYMYQNIDWK